MCISATSKKIINTLSQLTFHQLFTVHGFLRSNNCVKQVPLAFVLMSHHRKGDYTQVFKAILDSLPNEANLEDVVCDFEAAIWQAVKECMPDVHLHGCHFHWCQAVYRKLNSLGLSTAYRKRGPLYHLFKRVLALPYLPRRHIHGAFDQLKLQAEQSAQIIQLFDYIETTWFQSATWDVVNWCNFKKLVRTNNDAEGWHRRLNTRAGGSSVPIYKLLKDVLRKEGQFVTTQHQLVAEHILSSCSRKSSKDKQGKLHELWMQYERRELTTGAFLSACVPLVPL
ncbi:uncharacterized protein LOC123517043 isoform X1 [Portunus trituberculatus]|uniref:uncharacterized protein LOC123517043 isoform X1 n=2 Tax=Portunus trituberculatus TaxID=210409 RepID=UPI001E1CE803|nr:uncharacterized protein LOC123517043 isoform X1 [Portunus trituberculatus]